ncbi:LacI family DNA-binding transcriptional regulator [uncultured Draconibacterium sp.]|uniref:LacI family DNA-binding transcriptional regulator n=1 Tax=uncultured Draconibacterium sp. TaxID=1573823 RepID=UPI0029C971D6|nr:LacI family DNA-binding transcriptional regulator [uncultured Draconibacterium sp.]
MRKPNLTINDIAKALNISKSTVSRALRDTHDINPKTKLRVLEFAAKHDYHPDILAQSLRSRSTKTIGVIVPAYNIPFYSTAIGGIQDYAMKMGYNVIVCHSNEQYEIEIKNVEALLNAGVEGIIISVARDTEKNEHIKKLKNKGIPLVLFNRVIEDFKSAKVVVNDYYGAKNMVDYLIKTGCKKIAHITGPNNLLLSNNRKEGYLDALKDGGIEINEELIVEGDFTIQSGIRCTEKLLEDNEGIDAVFAVCDAVAFGTMKVLKKRGIRIPQDISVAGFTNEPMAELVEPSLTTVKQPIYEVGETASKLLFAQLKDPDLPAELCVLETTLEIRESTK